MSENALGDVAEWLLYESFLALSTGIYSLLTKPLNLFQKNLYRIRVRSLGMQTVRYNDQNQTGTYKDVKRILYKTSCFFNCMAAVSLVPIFASKE